MPWREVSPVGQRLEFIRDFETDLFTMTELSAQYGISRRTGYKWLERYVRDGARGLLERSRRPHHSPHRTDPDLVAALIAQRRRHPRWGAKKLLAVVRRQDPDAEWPARSTVCDLLKAHGLVRPRGPSRRPRATPTGRAPVTQANDLWTTDFKGEFRTGDRAYCYPLTLRDSYSRFVLRCDALLGRSYELTRPCFERAFREYGVPAAMRSDNGAPFAATNLGRVSRLAVWWMRLGIRLERIAPGHPEQNGSHEQFHAVLKAATTRPPAPHVAAQQRRFDRFCTEYNEERPHEALDFAVPASRYHPSRRAFPWRLPAIEYPGHVEVRRVNTAGQVSWRGRPLFLSEALMGEDVAFEEIADGLWTILFVSTPLGRLDDYHRRVHPIATVKEGRSASSAGSAPAMKNTKNEH